MGTDFTAFGFIGTDVHSVIDTSLHTVRVRLPSATAVTALVALFAHNGTGVTIGATPQVSGTTPNDFTAAKTYTVADGATTQDWTVTATVSLLDTTNSLATLSELRTYLSYPTAQTADDGRLEEAINAASWIANTYTDRLLKARLTTLYLDGPGGSVLALPDWPIADKTALQIWESTDTPRVWDATTLLDNDDLIIDEGKGWIHTSSGWNGYPQTIKVYGPIGYGYNGALIPGDLKRAVLQVSAKVWASERDGLDGKTSTSAPGGGSVSLDTERFLTPLAFDVFERYRRVA